jgi:uncharacterized repeat protein (TIGR03803 family)
MRFKKLCFGASTFFTALFVVLVLTNSAWAAREKILHNFVNLPNGASPQANLIADAAGNLYGTTYDGGEYGLGAVFKLSPGSDGASTETVLYSFFGGTDGAGPTGGLIWDSAGSLYGTTTSGGNGCSPSDCGVVFKLTPSSGGKWSQSVLYSFRGYSNGDGSSPFAALVLDSAGHLYGTTAYGGTGNGTVFKLTPTSGGGWTESILYAFTGNADGSTPTATLTFDSAGNIYSTALYGGDLSCGGIGDPAGCGTVFELTPQTNGAWKENTLYKFQGSPAFVDLSTSLAIDSRGSLYGTTSAGQFFYGSAFRLTRETKGDWNYKTLYAFAGGSDGYAPLAGLLFDAAGKLYGTTEFGGVISGKTSCKSQIGCGTIFELAPGSGDAWTERVLHKFSGGRDGAEPSASLISDQTGNLYTTTSAGGGGGCDYMEIGCGAVVKLRRGTGSEWTAENLYQFTASDGFDPVSTLIADNSGNFYGTTNAGGKGPGYFEDIGGQDCPYGCGTVFRLTRSSGGHWSRSVLYSFTGINGDGSFPWGSLIFDAAGNLYGTTEWGGAFGSGTVFELIPDSGGRWKEIVLYSFTGHSDGGLPVAGLIFDAAGNLYGTTSAGGVGTYGSGTVFELSPAGNTWKETVLYGFTGTNGDGAIPTASLIFDAAGNLYGTTSLGGGGDCGIGHCGTAFELSPVQGGWKETVLHAFIAANGDGAGPQGSLVIDDAGDLYGTTWEGGIGSSCPGGFTGCGTVFKLTRKTGNTWKETIVHNFGSYDGDGDFPAGGLAFDLAGNLYGTTKGGTKGSGTVFKLTPISGGHWAERVLHTFAGYPSDGAFPVANIILDAEGNLYGTTSGGGLNGNSGFGGFQAFGGTVFEITP